MPEPRFPLGQTVATRGALAAFKGTDQTPLEFFLRHVSGDWGETDTADQQSNEAAIKDGDRILSVYSLRDGTRIYVITEADRSVTTILLPEEYQPV